MAGRPASRRVVGGGLSGLHYGLFSSIFITVAAVGGFIWQLTSVESIKAERDQFKSRLDEYGTPPDYYKAEAAARGSPVFVAIDDDRKKLAWLATSEPDAYASTVVQEVATLLGQVDQNHPNTINTNDSLIKVIRKLDQEANKQKRVSNDRQGKLEALQEENESLNVQIQGVKDDFQKQVDVQSARIAELQGEFESYKQDRDASIQRIEQEVAQADDQKRKIMEDARRRQKSLELALAKAANQVTMLQNKIQEIAPTTFDPDAILTKADGRIMRAIPGSDVVYINLGEDDRLKIGMGFEVYSQTRESTDRIRGKASVEVVSLTPATAECRVTRRETGRPIIENDIIVNISYERDRRPTFVIAGAFDLDYDGEVDSDGVEKIAGLIREWGGDVVSEFDETTDFVIIGASPSIPRIPAEARTRIVMGQIGGIMKELLAFRELITQASEVGVPVITQNQFLYLTGYAGGTSLAAR